MDGLIYCAIYIVYLVLGAIGNSNRPDDFLYYLALTIITLVIGYILFAAFSVSISTLIGYGFLAFISALLGWTFS